ncbi:MULTISPECIES: hypothetical protein [unclassified Enterococcus]|jgi:hypothetical protein|uniref:hypothetical protein n=1 Tax=unclassified Enterococcus TaxID=2608891 RepID=UPI000352A00C|nr:hypothetical protein D920_02874 [Enterococcus faecalis 13-SD-W-01]
METIRKDELVAQPTCPAKIIPFVSLAEIQKIRDQLVLAGFQTEHFSDTELIIVLQRKKQAGSPTVLTFLLDWFLEKYYIRMNAGKKQLISEEKNPYKTSGISYQQVGELDQDTYGEYYLMAASVPGKKLAGLYKVYTDGKIMEMRI